MTTSIVSSTLGPTVGKGQTGLSCWCGQSAWTTLIRTERFGVLQCSHCGTHRIDPPPVLTESDSAHFYTDYYETVGTDAKALPDPSRSQTAGFWKVAEQVPILNQVRNSVIDIGSGDGHLCAELAGCGWPFVGGFDVSKSRVLRARRLYPELRFYDVPLSASGIATGSLDLVVMEAVIEHLPDPLAFLREVTHYLAPGGLLVLTTPNMDSGQFRLLGRRWTGMLAPHAHIFLFSPQSIAHLIERAGLKDCRKGSYHTPVYRPMEYLKRLGHGDIKGTIWRAHQEIGGVYGRLINRGPMLYAVGRKPL